MELGSPSGEYLISAASYLAIIMAKVHLGEELPESKERVTVETRFGPVTGGRTKNGATVFLEIPYALPPTRFEDPIALPADYRYEQKEYILESACALVGRYLAT
ncbi:hypothetical protein EVG20_g3261 [Dentipellis fragilis]|uniref:Uncharacterized protein n=1 Tax=Dentipellis fragilis TaxID=205917 RepID=A0A4Y9Z505_9AGAM|nr:hypothetical protein EVG20_g3261 [Dentipellis fragilis]